jgi:hypothetical protein
VHLFRDPCTVVIRRVSTAAVNSVGMYAHGACYLAARAFPVRLIDRGTAHATKRVAAVEYLAPFGGRNFTEVSPASRC